VLAVAVGQAGVVERHPDELFEQRTADVGRRWRRWWRRHVDLEVAVHPGTKLDGRRAWPRVIGQTAERLPGGGLGAAYHRARPHLKAARHHRRTQRIQRISTRFVVVVCSRPNRPHALRVLPVRQPVRTSVPYTRKLKSTEESKLNLTWTWTWLANAIRRWQKGTKSIKLIRILCWRERSPQQE